MSGIGKSYHPTGKSHAKPLPREFLQSSSPSPKIPLNKLWNQRMGNFCLSRLGRPSQSPKLENSSHLQHCQSNAKSIAMHILFPGIIANSLQNIANMPENTPKERTAKENAFRELLLEKFELRDVIADKNGGIRAIICSLINDIDPQSEEITVTILRGDILEHLMRNSRVDGNFHSMKDYCSQMAKEDIPIGKIEIQAMADILERSIHLFSFENFMIGEQHEIQPEKEFIFGGEYDSEPLLVYFNPIDFRYQPMKSR